MKKCRIGILGGTFNPIHNGHIELALAAYKQYELEKVLLMVSPNPPHKAGQKVIDVTHRNAMVKLAIEPFNELQFSDFEQKREGFIYTAETLLLLKKELPDNEYYFVVGGDSLDSIEKWYHPEIVFANCVLLASGRDYLEDSALKRRIEELNIKYNADIRMIDVKPVDVSSTEVRNGESLEIPEKVAAYIKENRLYE